MRFKVPGGSKEFVSGSKYQEALRSLYQVQSAPCIALSPTRTTVLYKSICITDISGTSFAVSLIWRIQDTFCLRPL